MGVRERIRAIRLMEKLEANPEVAEKLGIAVVNAIRNAQDPLCAKKDNNI